MSNRLDRMIARLQTQRQCLTHALAQLADLPGPILEVGLGKGRTYSFLQTVAPDRVIYAFDRDVHAPADAQPPAERLFLGEIEETLPAALAHLQTVGAAPVLVHADIGTEPRQGNNRPGDDRLARFVATTVAPFMAAGGLLAGDRNPGADCGLSAQQIPGTPLPDGIAPWPYFLYRKNG